MAVELKFSGMCGHHCDCCDLKLVPGATEKYVVACEHEYACRRMYNNFVHRAYAILLAHGQKDHQFKLGETIKYSPTEVLKILQKASIEEE